MSSESGEKGAMRIEPAASCNVANIASLWRNGPHWHTVWPEGPTWCYRTAEDAAARAVEVAELRAAHGLDRHGYPAEQGAAQSVIQEWVLRLPMMQQTVLLTAVRGPDGLPKYHATKFVLRWYRRCILRSALDGVVLADPYELNGGSFTGPSTEHPYPSDDWRPGMDDRITEYLRSLDEVPHHFQLHLMHAVEVLGYKHPDPLTRDWWQGVYSRLVHDMHLWPETEEQLDRRLGDTREGWLARGDVATNE